MADRVIRGVVRQRGVSLRVQPADGLGEDFGHRNMAHRLDAAAQ